MQESLLAKKNTKAALKQAKIVARAQALRQNLLKRKQQVRGRLEEVSPSQVIEIKELKDKEPSVFSTPSLIKAAS